MRFTQIQYLEKECVTVSIQNCNASRAILDGQVVAAISQDALTTQSTASPATANANSLGVAAMTMTDAAASTTNSAGLIIGIAKINPTTTNISTTGQASLPVGGVTEAICYGFTDALIQTRTRATSTDSWASVAAIAAGDQLIPEITNRNLVWQGTLSLSAARVAFIAAQAVASEATANSIANTGNGNAANALYETQRMKVRVCCM